MKHVPTTRHQHPHEKFKFLNAYTKPNLYTFGTYLACIHVISFLFSLIKDNHFSSRSGALLFKNTLLVDLMLTSHYFKSDCTMMTIISCHTSDPYNTSIYCSRKKYIHSSDGVSIGFKHLKQKERTVLLLKCCLVQVWK